MEVQLWLTPLHHLISVTDLGPLKITLYVYNYFLWLICHCSPAGESRRVEKNEVAGEVKRRQEREVAVSEKSNSW